jgi:cytoskeletal protein CcmA (bactofilin family)
MKHLMALILGISVLLLAPTTAQAFEIKQGDTVTVVKEQKIEGSLMAGGNSVVIDGLVTGDVFCAGKKVVISGTVDGDLICAAQEMIISGIVTGDARLATQSLYVQGRIEGNATTLSQSITFDPTADINGEVLFASQSFLSQGFIGPLAGVSKYIELAGEVKGDAQLGAQELVVGKDARIFGSLKYTSEKPATIADGAAVSGVVSHVIPAPEKKPESKEKASVRNAMASWPANAVTGVIFYLLLSLIANALFSRKIHEVAAVIEKKWLLSMGVGMLAAIALPFVSLFLLVTIIGILLIPIPILAAAVATGFGRIVAAQVFGKSVLKGFKLKNADNLYMQSLIGVPILWCMFKAPFVGGLFTFISIILGLGAFILSFQKSKK